jgi:thymidylate synthase
MNTTDRKWRQLLKSVLDGHIQVPRGLMTTELLGLSEHFDMKLPAIESEARGLSYRFMAAEALWIMDGDNSLAGIAPYNKNMARYSDNGTAFFGAYGPKIMEQVDYIVDALSEDRSTRQAVSTIWRERPPKSRDIPCTVSLAWMIRGSEIHCFASMRSSDLWLGLPYDIFNFSAITRMIRDKYHSKNPTDKLLMGNLYWSANSADIYETDRSKVKAVLKESPHGLIMPHDMQHDFGAFRQSLLAIRDDPRSELDWVRSDLS